MRRMDRYKGEQDSHQSRLNKNQELYDNISNDRIYTNITDVTNANAFEISNQTQTTHTTREAYHQMQQYQNIEPIPQNKRELNNVNYLSQNRENKIYDINSVLEQAHKNRQEKDEKEGKRMLKNNSYNILAGINKEELEKYREEKKQRMLTPQEEELREIIDTIASKTLAGELDKETTVDLLSDLMATNMLDKVEGMEQTHEEKQEAPEKTEEIKEETLEQKALKKEEIEEIEKRKDEPIDKLPEKDNDFYTRSMDLSDKDFDFESDFNEKPLSKFIKFIIFLIIIALIAVAGYFIYQRL